VLTRGAIWQARALVDKMHVDGGAEGRQGEAGAGAGAGTGAGDEGGDGRQGKYDAILGGLSVRRRRKLMRSLAHSGVARLRGGSAAQSVSQAAALGSRLEDGGGQEARLLVGGVLLPVTRKKGKHRGAAAVSERNQLLPLHKPARHAACDTAVCLRCGRVERHAADAWPCQGGTGGGCAAAAGASTLCLMWRLSQERAWLEGAAPLCASLYAEEKESQKYCAGGQSVQADSERRAGCGGGVAASDGLTRRRLVQMEGGRPHARQLPSASLLSARAKEAGGVTPTPPHRRCARRAQQPVSSCVLDDGDEHLRHLTSMMALRQEEEDRANQILGSLRDDALLDEVRQAYDTGNITESRDSRVVKKVAAYIQGGLCREEDAAALFAHWRSSLDTGSSPLCPTGAKATSQLSPSAGGKAPSKRKPRRRSTNNQPQS